MPVINLPSPADILELARTDPIVCACIQSWHLGHCNWEQALMQAVVWLARANHTMRDMTLERLQREPASPMLIPRRPDKP